MFTELKKTLDSLCEAEDYGTSEGAVKAAETRRAHGGSGTTEIVQNGNSHILVSPSGASMGEYGNRKMAIKAANGLGYLPGTVTQGGTTVMMNKSGKATREMPHWNNHDKSVRQMNRLQSIGYIR